MPLLEKSILTDCKIWLVLYLFHFKLQYFFSWEHWGWQSPLEITWSSPLLRGGSPRASWVTSNQVLSISKDEDFTTSVTTCFLVQHNGKSIYFISMEFLASQHTHCLATEHSCQESGSLSFTPQVSINTGMVPSHLLWNINSPSSLSISLYDQKDQIHHYEQCYCLADALS